MGRNPVTICRIDELGRVCLPEAVMKQLDIRCNSSISMDVVGGRIVMQKEVRCHICGLDGETRRFKGLDICLECLAGARSQDVLTENQ